MQRNENLSNVTIFDIVKEQIGVTDFDEAIALHEEYQKDKSSKICTSCNEIVSPDALLYVENGGPLEAYNACPECSEQVDAFDLQKPDFELWLKLTKNDQ